MDAPRIRCVLDVIGGPSRRVDRGGVMIGRQGDCELVATDPSVSRRHAIVRLAGDGVELVPLGRTGISVNGRVRTRPCTLADGDRIGLPGFEARASIDVPAPGPGTTATFVVTLGEARFGITTTPFIVGGGTHDDMIVTSWPARVFGLHLVDGELFVEPYHPATMLDGNVLDPGVVVPVHAGQTLAFRARTLRIDSAGEPRTTAIGGDLPHRIDIEMLPRGGQVWFSIGERRTRVYLADRRLDLVMALVRPPAGHVAGDYLADEVLGAIVWPRKAKVSRSEINMLISRCRRDFIDAGLPGPRLIERAPTGGATRLAIGSGAQVVVST